jgi:hypothetical protein
MSMKMSLLFCKALDQSHRGIPGVEGVLKQLDQEDNVLAVYEAYSDYTGLMDWTTCGATRNTMGLRISLAFSFYCQGIFMSIQTLMSLPADTNHAFVLRLCTYDPSHHLEYISCPIGAFEPTTPPSVEIEMLDALNDQAFVVEGRKSGRIRKRKPACTPPPGP